MKALCAVGVAVALGASADARASANARARVAASLRANASASACTHLGPALVDHTCFHARLGPYASVRAASPAVDAVDSVHTYYEVALAASPAIVTYTPARSGAWAVFTQFAIPLVIRAAGADVAVMMRDAVPTCPFLAEVQVVMLEAGTRYELVLGPTPASAVGVVIEKLDDFVAIHGRDRDGDGYGDPGDIEVSPCVPSPGFAANDGDCDDGDARTYPGAPEACGDIDRNCNGIAGDDGAACASGVGACAVAGTASCAGTAWVCSAQAAAPGVEQCNGIDDDCDGIDDADEALCGDAEAPRCVVDGRGGRFCGCERDADCGAADSGRSCLLRGTEQRCIDGCVDGFARNGCPAGQRCTSTDPAQPGVCASSDGGGCASSPGGATLAMIGFALAMARRRSTGRAAAR